MEEQKTEEKPQALQNLKRTWRRPADLPYHLLLADRPQINIHQAGSGRCLPCAALKRKV
jgi:hypothetical protein